MKLVSVQIKNYKSIEDSELFTIGDVTCLVLQRRLGC